MSENEAPYALRLCTELRLNGFKVDMDYNNRNLKANFKQADKLNSKFIIIIGEEEVKERFLTIKNNHTKEEEKVDFDYLVMYLDEKLNEECDCCHHE